MHHTTPLCMLGCCMALAGGACGACGGEQLAYPSQAAPPSEWRVFSLQRAPDYGEQEVAGILAYLRRPDADDATASAIKNNLMDRLLERPVVTREVGESLLSLREDGTLSERTRDYVLQHFATYVRRTRREPEDTPDPLALRMLAVLRQTAREEDSATGGTALLGLQALVSEHGPVTAEEVGSLAVRVATARGNDVARRATALQVAAQLGRREAMGSARSELDQGGSTLLRMSAAAYLVRMGDAQDRQRLAEAARSDADRTVRSAASRLLEARPPDATVKVAP